MMRSGNAMRTAVMGLLVVVAGAALAMAEEDAATLREPAEIIHYLIDAGGVSRYPTDEAKAYYSLVEANPAAYAATLNSSLRLPVDVTVRAADSTIEQFQAGVSLLRLLGPEQGGALGQSAYALTSDRYQRARDLYDQAAAADDEQAAQQSLLTLSDYVRLRRRVIKELAAVGSPILVDACLATLAHEDYSVQVSMLYYLEETAAPTPELLSQLNRLYEDPASTLKGDAALAHAISTLQNGSR